VKKTLFVFVSVLMLFASIHADAKTENGNDLCLYLDEAMGNKKETEWLVSETKGKNYYFRYMKIIARKAGRENGRPYIKLSLMEPSSYYVVRCKVIKPNSLMLLMQDPESREGDCVAMTAKIEKIDTDASVIYCNPVIIRTKDREAPKRGKEFLYETDPNAVVYQFTALEGKLVTITAADQDIIPWLSVKDTDKAAKLKEEIQSQYTKEEWHAYLTGELDKRKSGKHSKRGDAARRAGLIIGQTNAPVLTDAE
jgi:hypothetical protein